MGQCDERWLAIRQHDLLHEGGEVLVIFGKRAHVALARIGQRPPGATLPAPIHRGDGKAAPTKIGYDLEIFLDELAAPLKHAHSPTLWRARGLPTRETQFHAARRFENTRGRPAR